LLYNPRIAPVGFDLPVNHKELVLSGIISTIPRIYKFTTERTTYVIVAILDIRGAFVGDPF
jgi:hypothetical protein